LKIAEGAGAVLGKDLVLFSGFTQGFSNVTTDCYALDTTNPNAVWRKMDDFPFPPGLTHTAHLALGMKWYFCGGFEGATPGPDRDPCYVYDHSKAPGTSQWTALPRLPEGRAGGGLVYIPEKNSLLYAAGARRTTNYLDTWMLDLGNLAGGWVKKVDFPYKTNHMSAVTAVDKTGRKRHYFLGGQSNGDERNGNHKDV
jgi:hypothetical protein